MNIVWMTSHKIDKIAYFRGTIELMEQLSAHGHPTMLIANYAAEQKKFGIPVAYLPKSKIQIRWLSQLVNLNNLRKYIAGKVLSHHADIVIADNLVHLLISTIFLRARNVKIIYDIRSLPVPSATAERLYSEFKFYVSLLVAKYFCDGITVITPALKNNLEKRIDLRGKKIGIWCTGVSPDIFSPAAIPENNAPLAGLENYFKLIYSGSASKSRGLRETIMGLSLIVHKYPSIAFIILGSGADSLKELVSELGLSKNVFLIPPVDHTEVPAYIAACDTGIIPLPDLPAWRVSASLKLMEFLSMEKPVILSAIEMHKVILGKSDFIIYLENIDPKTIADAIELAYLHKETFKSNARKGRELVLQKYTYEKQAENLIQFLHSIRD